MRYPFFLFLLLVWAGCACRKDVEPAYPSYIDLTINHATTVRLTPSNPAKSYMFGGNENCNVLFVKAISGNDSPIGFYLYFELTKQGYLRKAMYQETSTTGKTYQNASFNIQKDFQIQNFKYDPARETLYFEFEGNAHEDYHPAASSLGKRHLKGKVYLEGVFSLPCYFFPDEILPTPPSPALRITHKLYAFENGKWQCHFFTDDGYLLTFHTIEKLGETKTGEYVYNASSPIRVSLRKYKGEIKSYAGLSIYDNEWEDYACEGTWTISEQTVGSMPYTGGKFSLHAKDANGNVMYSFPEVLFKIANL